MAQDQLLGMNEYGIRLTLMIMGTLCFEGFRSAIMDSQSPGAKTGSLLNANLDHNMEDGKTYTLWAQDFLFCCRHSECE